MGARFPERQVLFLDYDGVLHRGDAYITSGGVVSSSPGNFELFEFASALNALLEPYPQLEIVLSTDWCRRFGFERARASIPVDALRQRVTGATHEATPVGSAAWPTDLRGAEVLRYVRRHRVVEWLAVDDRRDGFHGYLDRLIHCQTECGLGDEVVIELFRRRLAERFGEKPSN
jgi:hypothetical protein